MGGNKSPFFKLNENITLMALFQTEVNIYKSYLQSFWRYYLLIKKVKPDYIIDVCTALSLFSVPLRLLLPFKLISWEHFNTSVKWNAFTPRIARWLVSNFANNVVVLTNTDKVNYENTFSAKNVITISNPITISHQLKANLNSNIVLSIGRFTPQKGFDLLLHAWVIVQAKMPHIKLHIVGDGELKLSLLQLAGQLNISNSIQWFEPTSMIEKYYEESSLYVMSSRFEGLPLVLIEAKSFGLPIVSFDCETGPREIVRDQIDGILVPALDSNALAAAIIRLMQHESLRVRYGNSALNDMSRFSLDEIANKWVKILQ